MNQAYGQSKSSSISTSSEEQYGRAIETARESLERVNGVDSLKERELEDETSRSADFGELRTSYLQIPFGFQSRGSYKHASKNCEIVGVTYNSRFRQFVFLDSRGITSWSYESVYSTVTRHLNYPSYQFNVLRLIIFSRKFNVYFALSKEYALKVFNLNFHEVFSVSADMHSVLCMVFNHVKDELITGGTGGMKFWTFGEIENDKQKAWERYSRPMANYGLVLRASYPDMGGSWVKQVELDEAMQRLYCLSERNVVAYDMEGNLLFQITDAHRGPVTGCVYSKACNFIVTVGTDCDVNVWSRSKSGGKVHTFTGHSKAITKIMLHPETSALVITAALDGIVKVNSLDLMEEIYSLPVFSEGIYWMNIVSVKHIYCCSNRVIEVFSLNHLCDFWALSRCSVTSLSLVTCRGKSTRVMAIGNDSSVRLISQKKRQNLSTVLPPPPISPLNMVKDVTYNREFNMMYLLIGEQEIWVYYTRTNPATRVESWKLDFIEDIHRQQSQEAAPKSRASSPWVSDGNRSPSPVPGDSRPSSNLNRESSSRDSSTLARKEKVKITCLGMLYSPIIMQCVEGQVCPDATQFLMAGTQDGRVLFLHMFWQGLKYHQLQANKDAVLEVYHDQETGTMVTKCRHPGIVILIWSLPFLQLLKRVDCDADMTCFTRMNNLLLCGHKSGYLHLHSLVSEKHERVANEDERMVGSKYLQPRDHQNSVNSVDSNDILEIFCSASCDGVIKIWDKDKTLLREIIMNETLTVASFLNYQGDILIGFKQHIFIIPNTKVYPMKDGLPSAFGDDNLDDDAFETESDIYEDPSVRFESKKILLPDPTNMDNYLVPFPNLQLKTSWFMEGRPPPDLEQQNQQEEKESISSMSDSLSFAPTEVYFSPSSTPRRLSMASSVALSEHQSRTKLWELPEFGHSPVSSPPRTPPPEPAMPSTPSLEEESDEELSEDEKAKDEPVQGSQPSCDQCTGALKQEGKRNVPFIPSFRRGRLGNISIDSKSLRSGHGGPGYAAPVVRKVATENSEPKSFKPRHPPKPVVKKTKKSKENEKENSVERSGNQDDYKSNNESTQTKEDMNVDDAVSESKNDDASYRPTTNAHVLNMPEGGSWLSREPLATIQNGVHAQTKENQTKATDAGTAKDEGGPQEETLALATPKATEGNRAKTQLGGKTIVWNTEEEIQNEDQNSAFDGTNGNNGETLKTQRSEELPDIDYSMVSYTGPVFEELQHGQGKVSERVEVMDAFDEHDEVEGIDEAGTSCGKTRLSSLLHGKGGEQGQKKVKASGGDNRRRHRNLRHLATRRNSPFSRVHNSSVTLKESVLPVYNGRRRTDSPSEISKNSMNVTPVTIFALARNRRENTTQKHGRSVNGSLGQKKEMTETSNLSKKEADKGIFELHNDDITQFMDKTNWKRPAYHGTVDISRPPSVQKSESSLMRWCIKALKKVDLEVLFPPKPIRPKSSPSSVKSETAKKERGNLIQLNNTTTQRSRPKTADSILSTTSSTKEHSWFHHEDNPSTNETVKQQPRDFKSAASLVQSSKWEQVTSDNDEDFLDGYRAIKSGIVFQEPKEDDVKDMSRESAGFQSDIPVIGTSDYYGGIWQIKVLDRASRLQELRQERQKTAKERRQALESKQREKWKTSSHLECAQVSKSEGVIEFITPPPTTSSRNTTPLPSSDLIQNRLVKEQEFASERPYRLRLSSESIGQRLNPVARNLINLKTSDHHVSDVVNVLPKPPPSASIPSKCSRYVLVAQPDDKQPQIQATMMEETLLMVRFPRTRIRRKRHNSAASPKVLSNRKVTIES